MASQLLPPKWRRPTARMRPSLARPRRRASRFATRATAWLCSTKGRNSGARERKRMRNVPGTEGWLFWSALPGLRLHLRLSLPRPPIH